MIQQFKRIGYGTVWINPAAVAYVERGNNVNESPMYMDVFFIGGGHKAISLYGESEKEIVSKLFGEKA